MSADLAQLVKRLESVTSRLEDISVRTGSGPSSNISKSATVAHDDHVGSPSLSAFDEILSDSVAKYLDLSSKVGGVVQEQSALVKKLFELERQLLVTAAKSKKPDQNTFQSLLKPLSEVIMKITELKDKNRTSPLINHLSTVAEGIPALGWVAVEPKPAPFIDEMKNAAQFYGNRILKDYKEKDKTHVDWSASFMTVLTELHGFVKKFHTTGLVWNPQGSDAKAAASAAAPPPPPAPAPMALSSAPSTVAQSAPDMNALFGELNKGASVTAGLKKVEKSQMTHKNPELRASGVVKASTPSVGTQSGSSVQQKPAAKAPARVALEGNKWVVENQDGKNVVLDQVELKQTVYIYGCNNATVQIKGKVTAVSVDNCKKTGIVLESVVGSLEIVNCKSMQAQILGKAPTALIDKTDGLVLFLSQQCLDIEILTAKSSELNVTIPGKTANDDPVEKAIPEQLRTVIAKDGSLVTGVVEHKG